MTLGEKIQLLRKKNGWSQETLAEKIHVSRQALSKWEADTAAPNVENIVQLSKLFGVTTDYLLHDEDDSVENPSNGELDKETASDHAEQVVLISDVKSRKRNKRMIVLAVIIALLLIWIMLLINNIHNLRMELDSVQPQIIYDDSDEETESYLFDTSCELVEGSFSVENGTVDYRVKLTPYEFNDETSIRLKVQSRSFEEEYELERNDNVFSGTITVSAFEGFSMTAIMENDGKTRTDGADGEDAYCYSDYSVLIGGYSLSWFDGHVSINNELQLIVEEEGSEPETINVVLKQAGKEIYNKKIGLTIDPKWENRYKWKDKIEIPEGEPAELYVVFSDEHDL